jgi:rhodanese-related sulfurtransferase
MKFIDLDQIQQYEILDTRIPDLFERGFIPGSINVGLNGSFEQKIKTVFPNTSTPLLVVSDKNELSFNQLNELGYSNLVFLENGFKTYIAAQKPIDVIISVSTEEFELDLNFNNEFVVDVRNPVKYNSGHVLEAINIPYSELPSQLNALPKDKVIYLYCSSGYSSMIASSLLRKNGFLLIKNVYGGIEEISKTKIPIIQNA